MARNILVGTEFVLPNAYKFDFPCLIIHGMKDMVTSHEDSIAFYNKCSRYKIGVFLLVRNLNVFYFTKRRQNFEVIRARISRNVARRRMR